MVAAAGARELTLTRVAHPDPMPEHVAGPGVILIVDPVADPITRGDPTLGWEGDARLGLYFNVPRRAFELWRLETTGAYMRVARLPGAGSGGINAPEAVARLIVHLVTHDTRRGYDVKADVDAHNRTLDRVAAKATADKLSGELVLKRAGVPERHRRCEPR